MRPVRAFICPDQWSGGRLCCSYSSVHSFCRSIIYQIKKHCFLEKSSVKMPGIIRWAIKQILWVKCKHGE